MINPSFKFNKEFGLTWSDRFDGSFISILILTILFNMIAITILSLIDYDAYHKKAEQFIRKKYKELYTSLVVMETRPATEENSNILSIESARRQARQKMRKINREVANTAGAYIGKNKGRHAISEYYDQLPDVDDYVDEMEEPEELALTHPARYLPSGNQATTDINNYDPGTLDDPLKHPFNYVVHRRGSMYIEMTDDFIDAPKEKAGYRNPDEVEKVVNRYQPMIEHCFKKEARFNPGLKGYIKVAFSISYEGYVIPESIRIIGSTLRNKRVEQCIKNYIRQWRSFARLDESMGIARVIQKFIFN